MALRIRIGESFARRILALMNGGTYASGARLLAMRQNDSPLAFGLHLPLVRLNAEAFGALIAPHSIKVPD